MGDRAKQRVLLIDLGAHFGGVENYLVSLAELLEGEVELHALWFAGVGEETG